MSHSPAVAQYNAALDALQGGNATAALAAIEKALVEDPRDSESWQIYILILNALGRADEAKTAEAKLAALGISSADEAAMRAAAAMASGDSHAAANHYRAAIAEAPDRAELHTSLAFALLEAGGAGDHALAAATRAVGIAPGDAHAHYAHGRVLRLTGGDKSVALASYSRALELDPTLMLALYEQGMLLADTGQPEAALRNFEQYLKANPGDPSATQAVAQLRSGISETR